MDRRRALDDRLLDRVGEIEGFSCEGPVWRVVRTGRDVLDGSRGSGRWNTSDMSVLYSALDPDGAIAEIHFHLNRGQSVFPSKMSHDLFKLNVAAQQTLQLVDMGQLRKLGVEENRYREILYTRTQEIAAAAAFLGFDGLIAPSARWECQNVVLFIEAMDFEQVKPVSVEPVNWRRWRQKNASVVNNRVAPTQ